MTPLDDLNRIKLAIRRELKADGCTQKDLARYLGVSPVSVSRILTGNRQGSHELLAAMAHAVGLTVAAEVRKTT
jgi:transcriptional regulator with XRE-family HTH domain